MYSFILSCWIRDKIKSESQIRAFVTKGFLTEKEAEAILSTPKKQ